jgi:hypothetical protein
MKRALSWTLGGVSAFIAIYVGYAHVASWHVVGQYAQPSIQERFESESRFREVFTESHRGPLSAQVTPHGLHITGQTSAPDGTPAWLQFVSKERRLEDDVVMHMRFRVADRASYDLNVGIARGDDPLSARELKLGLSNHPEHPEYRLLGDHWLGGERPMGDRVLSDFRHRVPFTNPEGVHVVTLRVSPNTHMLHAAVDDIDAGSFDIAWWTGTPVQFAFGLVGRDPGQAVDVTIEQVSYDPIISPFELPVFVERFDGKILDPDRWQVKMAEGSLAESSLQLAQGLHLRGRALPQSASSRWIHPVRLLGLPMDLGSFELAFKLRASELHDARVVVGMVDMTDLLREADNWRGYTVGLREDPQGRGAFIAGAWGDTGQLDYLPLPQVDAAAEHEIILRWDAATRQGVTLVDGKQVDERKYDLQAFERTAIVIDTSTLPPAGAVDVVIRELRYSHPRR